jgi:hypothetical protein
MKLISPSSLQSILRNITPHLPEGYELIADTKTEDIHQYYKLSKVSIVANSHCIKFIIHIPLKSIDLSFTLYKINVLPERISSDKFVQYVIEYPYLAIQVSQQGYIHFAEKDYSNCVLSSITVCPFDSAIFNTQRLTCEASLFVQSPNSQHLCKRNLLLNYQQSTMIQHRNVWIYHFPTPRQLSLRCPGNEASPPRTQVLLNAGLLFNASACHVSTKDLHNNPTLRGSMQTELDTPHIFLPDTATIISQYESHQLQELTMPTLQALDNLQSRLVTPLHAIDVDSLLHLHHTSRKLQTEIGWHKIVLILITITLLLGLLYFIIRSHFDKLRCATTKTQDTESANPLKTLSNNLEHQNHDRETQNAMSCFQATRYNTRVVYVALDAY